MAGLNSQYIAAFTFEEVILDKDTGLPLEHGLAFFYKDNSREDIKNVFELTSYPAYDYKPLSNPVTISGGLFVDDNGKNTVPYFFPYNGDTGELELYYVKVYSTLDGVTGSVFQFDREAEPSSAISSGVGGTAGDKNYIPNGQFLLHNNVHSSGETTRPGEIIEDVTIVAPGGWTFERSTGVTSEDSVLFNYVGSPVSNPTGSPKYICNLICYTPDIHTSYKSLLVKFLDVNKFAGTQAYNLFFSIRSTTASPITVNLIKNFGTGGPSSPEESIPLRATIPTSSSFSPVNVPIVFGTNIGKTIGTSRDDYIQIEFALPDTTSFNIEITDVALTMSSKILTEFPVMTDEEMVGRSLAGWTTIPLYDAEDLYLPVLNGPNGFVFDRSQIGKVYSTMGKILGAGELNIDGASYKTNEYSPDLIPYSRLQKILWSDTIQTPVFGTGSAYMTAIYAGTDEATTEELLISNNLAGIVTNAADGTIPTGFTITNVFTGTVSNFVKTYGFSKSGFYIESLFNGDASIGAGNSGFTVADNIYDHEGNYSKLYNIMSVVTIAATSLASKYFTFFTHDSLAVQKNFYVWYKVDGAGTDPAQSGTGIMVSLYSTDTDNVVALKTQLAMNGYQVTSALTLAGTSVTGGSYFTIWTTTDEFYIWYERDGAGIDPAVSNAIGIKVSIVTADTNLQVAAKTQTAINMYSYALPDIRGLFLRASGGSANRNDPDAAIRYSDVPGLYGDLMGTYQYDVNMYHEHHTNSGNLAVIGSGLGNDLAPGGNNQLGSGSLQGSGYSETRPLNISLNYIIKY